jgi:hypothetical protein
MRWFVEMFGALGRSFGHGGKMGALAVHCNRG